jgi:two-component system invasion response regulator UvrY
MLDIFIYLKMYRILIVDDHSIVRKGIKLLLKERLEVESDEATDGRTVLEKIKEKTYDLLLLDINMPDTDAGKLLSTILSMKPGQKILIFSMNDEDLFAKHYLKLGAEGFLSKGASDNEIILAIQHVLSGKKYISPQLVETLGKDLSSIKYKNPFELLSERELAVAAALLKGHSISEISDTMALHPSTIGTYKSRIFDKLGIRSLIDLTELARIYKM